MTTLLIRLAGPMQSWGTTSRFDQRDTGKEPSKSGVIGLLAAAMGIDRENWQKLEPLARLTLAVRHDRPGSLKYDYQTAGCAKTDAIIKADGALERGGGIISRRYYLADAAFLVGLESEDDHLLHSIAESLHNPTWPLFLGRKSYLPTEPVFLKDSIQKQPLLEAISRYPWLGQRVSDGQMPETLLVSIDSVDETGTLKMDSILSSFSERKFGSRFVHSMLISCPKETVDVPSENIS
ncbi:MAG TPA: type I-E CRISPR-associated protein Cas5/CasD [Candidatus Rifleibacterium sp.]|nr:type I-E CRISPR-associated protein Cas5/CasD [Candidatus Rifleibacterium sp.]HPT47210.1 type I-E CRISPR-associated protein Cas5/CasD [Candidatus Rifleibacterium sp.]